MNVLEDYTTLGNTITDLLCDGDELSMIDSIQNTMIDASRSHNDEKIQFKNEIKRLTDLLQVSEKQTERKESKEEFISNYQSIQNKHQKTLENISQLQEKRLQLQQDINSLKQSPIIIENQKQIQILQDKQSLAEQKLRLYLNVFKSLNWDFDSSEIKGYIIKDNKTKVFCYDDANSVETADKLWDLL